MSRSRQIVDAFIKSVIREAVGDDPFDPFGRTKTKTKTDQRVKDILDQELDDLFNQPLSQVRPEPRAGREARGAPRAAPVRGTTKLADVSSITDDDIEALLSGMDTPEGFDFESEFEKGIAQGPMQGRQTVGRAAPFPGEGEGEEEDVGQGVPQPPPPKQKFFPTYDIAGSLSREEVARLVEETLMAEFVSPAMALGARVLPQVWMELSRLMKTDMRGFMAGFQVALNSIRETENEWFANLLGFMPAGPAPVNVPAEVKPTADRIRKVLDVYYDAVLKEAARNSENLVSALESIEARTDRKTFELGFFDALSKTRDVEDQAFMKFLGGPARLM